MRIAPSESEEVADVSETTVSGRRQQPRTYKVYSALPASTESFIDVAAREIHQDPDIINKMFEQFSQQILLDMKRKVSGSRVGSRSSSLRAGATSSDLVGMTHPSSSTLTKPSSSTLARTTPSSPKPIELEQEKGDSATPLRAGQVVKGKGWKAAKKLSRRESTFSSNLFNLFLQSKKNDFRTATVKERPLRNQSALTAIYTAKDLTRNFNIGTLHDMNAARRAKTVFPFSKL